MKNKHVKGLLLFCIGALLSVNAFAQQPVKKQKYTKEQKTELMTQDLKKELNLDDKQTNEVAAINRRATEELHQIRNNESLSQQEKISLTKQVQDRRTADIRALLTEQQRTKFEQHQQARQSEAKQKNKQPKRKKPASKRRGY